MVSNVFRRVMCAIDESLESVEAARQTACLAPREARLALVTVTQPLGAQPVVEIAPGVTVTAKREAQRTVERARTRIAELKRCRTLVLAGAAIPTLLSTIEHERTTLVAVGIHRQRLAGIALGSVATALLHDAPCSVYVGRGRFGVTRLPRSVVVGLDGSAEARAALDAASELAARIGARAAALVARGDAEIDRESVDRALESTPEVELIEDERGAVDALVGAGADLLVLGSRGLRGVRALGSVSERVAHAAPCPVLVVRRRDEASPGDDAKGDPNGFAG